MITYSDHGIRFSGTNAKRNKQAFIKILPILNPGFRLLKNQQSEEVVTLYYEGANKAIYIKAIDLMESYIEAKLGSAEDETITLTNTCHACGRPL